MVKCGLECGLHNYSKIKTLIIQGLYDLLVELRRMNGISRKEYKTLSKQQKINVDNYSKIIFFL